jgi:2-hydroxycyclohexanecarboxyl-CoA dehydrogenase
MTLARFVERTALVTGGASGIGAATARRLAEEGARVIVGDLDHEGARLVAKEIGGFAIALDVTDQASVDHAVAAGAHELGPIEVLVNNAGGDRGIALFLETEEDDWDFALALNVKGTMACTRSVLRGMYERRAGTIVNVASEAGHVGTVGGAAYAAAKGAILGFTKAIARESVPYGVRCNAVAPGPIDTPLLRRTAEEAGPRGARIRQGMIDATVMGRAGVPDEVAAAIAYLASDDASFLTGQTLAVSGGLSMS